MSPHHAEGPCVPELVGRSAELALLESAVHRVHESGTAWLLLGDPGVGKTALLNRAAGHAVQEGLQVLRAAGAQPESGLAFAGLHQILYPLLDRVCELPPAQQVALNRAFGVVDDAPPDRFTISAAALALLQRTADAKPVLLIVDDIQWIDTSSAQVLAFIQRRIAALPVVVVTAAHNGWRNPLDSNGIRTIDVAPLSRADAAALLTSTHPDLAAPAVERVMSEAMGNPLALVELPAQLNSRQRLGAEPLPTSLPLGERLEEGFAGTIRTLPEPARHTMLLAALAGQGEGGLQTVRAASRSWHGWDERALDAAKSSGLVTVDTESEEIAFRHPLVRSAVVRVAPSVLRRAAHHALAQVLEADQARRAWHLAEAADGPDESVAQTLVDAAEYALNRGGAAEATAALARAADLSPDPQSRIRRLVEGAFVAVNGGQLAASERMLKATEGEELPTELAMRRATTAALITFYRDGDVVGTHQAITRLLAAMPPEEWNDPTVEDAFDVWMLACFFMGRAEMWEPLHEAIDRVSPLTRLAYDALSDPARTAHAVRGRLRRTIAELPRGRRIRQASWLILTALYTDAFGDFGTLWYDLIDHCSYTDQQLLMAARQYDAFVHGRWNEVEALSEEGIERDDSRDYPIYQHLLRCVEALVAASRGDHARLQVLGDVITEWAQPRNHNLVLSKASEARVREATARGAYEEAYARASELTPPGVLPAYFPHFHRVFFDLVEACMHTGHVNQARAHVAAGRAARISGISSRHALILAGSAALTADDERADAAFQAALAVPAADQWPFELARIHLAYGEWLHRRSERAAARSHLARALEIFRHLKAEPWARRACEELRSAGAAQQSAAPGPVSLTAQELRIAELAAQGKTNKEIGQLVHLSPRTIGAHLYKIFPKLGITTRGALRDALREQPGRD